MSSETTDGKAPLYLKSFNAKNRLLILLLLPGHLQSVDLVFSWTSFQIPLAQTPPNSKQKERKHSQTENEEIFMSNFVF